MSSAVENSTVDEQVIVLAAEEQVTIDLEQKLEISEKSDKTNGTIKSDESVDAKLKKKLDKLIGKIKLVIK